MTTVRKNERSWGIELITQINQFADSNDLVIKRAGGESTVSTQKGKSMFPDVILYGDNELSSILQGWELKMPDVSITDTTFVKDAQRKAKALNLNSCVIWNFSHVKLYVYDNDNAEFQVKREWRNQKIKTRNDVQLYKHQWEKTLKSVLTSVNEYLISGDVKKTFLGEVLTKTSVSNLVNEYKNGVAETLREASNENIIIDAFITNWWKNIKTEYEGDETSMYSAYAKNIILNWTNRIIFAHLIKKYQQTAFIIDNVGYETTPHECNEILRQITEKSDFYNIFRPVQYNELLPRQTWSAIVELSLTLRDSPIHNINQHILQRVLEDSVNVSKRLVNGQYPTPPTLAKILSKITIHNILGECYDGCCGTGTIPNYIITVKKEKMGATKAMETTWASDKFQLPLQIANLAMTSYDTINIPSRLFQKDILLLKTGDKVEIVNPQTGKKETFAIPLFDSIVSNLPFVKSSEISADDTELIESLRHKYNLSGRSDLSYYIALHLKDLIKEGGYVGLILSNSFLGTESGYLFLNAVQEYFDEIKIHASANGRWFNNADIVTALLVMRRKIKEENKTEMTFFSWKRNLQAIETERDYEDIIVNSSLLNEDIDPDIISRVNYSEDEIARLRHLNVSYNSLFSNVKWLLEISDKLVPLSNHFKVFRGSRRGWDQLFYPQGEHNIEKKFLKDVLINARHTENYDATTDRKAFCCSLTMDELVSNNYSGALAWIRRFAGEKNGTGKPLPQVLSKPNMQWYELSTDEMAELFTMMNPDDRMFYAKFAYPTFINQRLIGLKRKILTGDLELLHALLNSIISLFYIEAVGFGRGLGVLDINKDSISKCYMLNPDSLSEEQADEIKSAFTTLKSRGVINFDKELSDPKRYEYDLKVLRMYSLDKYYPIIIQSLKAMRNMRKTVKQNIIQINTDNTNISYSLQIKNDYSLAAE